MTSSQLNFAATGASTFRGEFTSSPDTNDTKRPMIDNGPLSATLTVSAGSSVPSHWTNDITDTSSNDDVIVFSSYASKQDTSAPLWFTYYSLTKRTLDLAFASIGLFILSPFLLIIALLIKAETPGPAIFKQRRRGIHGRTFLIWKFRTMSVQEDGPTVEQARRGDRRVTMIGYLLRRSSIDELPQLLNVIRGEMSLVGPRPHPLALDDQHRTLISNYDLRHGAKPGITGWAQVNGCRGECSELRQMQARIDLDLWYVCNQSLLLDVRIVFLTILSLFRFDAY
jgi:lipopolysaccharide/colanic/teichoic acid biosynthesis glycosyltransferase